LRGNISTDPLTADELKKMRPLVPLTESAAGSKNLLDIFKPSINLCKDLVAMYPDIPSVILNGKIRIRK
jgi:hypothetical protein